MPRGRKRRLNREGVSFPRALAAPKHGTLQCCPPSRHPNCSVGEIRTVSSSLLFERHLQGKARPPHLSVPTVASSQQWPVRTDWLGAHGGCGTCIQWTLYYSAIKRNETAPFAEMWMDPETVIQSEVKSERKTNSVY